MPSVPPPYSSRRTRPTMVAMDTAADRQQITELFARYYTAVDEHDADAFVALWAEDGVFDSGYLHFEGREQLHAFIANHDVQTRHFVSNVFIDLDGDQARAHSYMLVVPSVGKAEVTATAHCVSELRKSDGRWRLTRHTYRADPSFTPPEVPA